MNLEFYILQDVSVPGTAGPSLFELLREKLRQGCTATDYVARLHGEAKCRRHDKASYRGLTASGRADHSQSANGDRIRREVLASEPQV